MLLKYYIHTPNVNGLTQHSLIARSIYGGYIQAVHMPTYVHKYTSG